MTRAVIIPPGLVDLPPGPELGVLLAGIDRAVIPNDMIVRVLRAEKRQLSHHQGRVLAMEAEVGRCTPVERRGGVSRAGEPVVDAIHEIAAALTLTTDAAFAEHGLAEQLRTQLPWVQAALWAGQIDRARAQLFARYTEDLRSAQATALCTELLPLAPGLTTGQLEDRLRRRVRSLDPDAFERRYRRAVTNRGTFGYLDRNGTATFGAQGLAPHEAAASSTHVHELARTIRRAGHPDTLPEIRADLFVALTDGSFQQMTNAQIVIAMLRRVDDRGISVAGGEDDEPPGSAPRPDAAPDPDSDPGPDVAPGSDPDPDPMPGPTSGAGRECEPDPECVPRPGGDCGEEPRSGIEVRIRLSTLLGVDDHDGELPGWGAIGSAQARDAVARQFGGEWRFAITDASGYLVLAGVTRHRPPRARAPASTGGSVELQVPATLLERLAANPPPSWERLIADLADRHAHLDELTAGLRGHPTARFPHAALRRHVEIRDRTCTHPGCRRSACSSQQDHTRDHQHGGPTLDTNLGPGCGQHHAVKTRGAWKLLQPFPGHFVWRSPLRQLYYTRGEAITPPVPDPVPADPRPDGPDPPDPPCSDHRPDFGPRATPSEARLGRLPPPLRRRQRLRAMGGSGGCPRPPPADETPF